MNGNYSIKLLSEYNDDGKYKLLLKEHFPLYTENRYDWFFKGNLQDTITYVALENRNSLLVGGASIYIRNFILDGAEEKMGIAVDFNIVKEHRVFGPAIRLQKELVNSLDGRSDVKMLFATPGKHASGVFRRAGYSDLGPIYYYTKKIGFTPDILYKRIHLISVCKILSIFLNYIIHINMKVQIFLMPKAYKVEALNKFDGRFDDLWGELKNKYKVIGDRSSTFLNWRYSSMSGREYKILALVRKDNDSLIGYLIYTLEGTNVVIVDLLSRQLNKTIKWLLLGIANISRLRNAVSLNITILENNMLNNLFKKHGFRSYRRELNSMYLPSNRLLENQKNTLKNRLNWYLFEGDLDL